MLSFSGGGDLAEEGMEVGLVEVSGGSGEGGMGVEAVDELAEVGEV